MSILVRASKLSDITKAIDTVSKIDVYVDEESNMIGFSAVGRQNVIRLIEGDYPQVMGLFPETNEGYAVINRKETLDALRRASLVVEKNSPVRLTFAPDTMTIEAGQGDNAQTSETVTAKLEGEELVMAFNPSLLRDGLDAIKTEYAIILYTQPRKPAIIVAQEKLEGEPNEDFRLLQMPIRLYN